MFRSTQSPIDQLRSTLDIERLLGMIQQNDRGVFSPHYNDLEDVKLYQTVCTVLFNAFTQNGDRSSDRHTLFKAHLNHFLGTDGEMILEPVELRGINAFLDRFMDSVMAAQARPADTVSSDAPESPDTSCGEPSPSSSAHSFEKR